MARPKKNDLPRFMWPDGDRGGFIVANPLTGKKRRFRDETIARATALELAAWLRQKGYRKQDAWTTQTRPGRGWSRAGAERRRIALQRATPSWADRVAMRAIYQKAKELTMLTGIQFSVDHMLPIQGERVSGLHCQFNLAIVPHWSNLAKSNHADRGSP